MGRLFTQLLRRAAIAYLTALPDCLCLSVEIFIRRRFGERYLSIWMLTKMYAVVKLAMLVFKGILFPIFDTQQLLWDAAVIVAAIMQQLSIKRRRKNRGKCDTYWPGDPHEIFTPLIETEKDKILLFRYFEPLAVILIGGVAWQMRAADKAISAWLFSSGIMLLIKRQKQFYAERAVIQDITDGQERSKRIKSALTYDYEGEKPKHFIVTATPAPNPASAKLVSTPNYAEGKQTQ